MGGIKKIYGIIGHPVNKSLIPAMHKAAIKHEKIDAEFKLFDIDPSDPENLANFCYETDLNNIAGFSVISPYKESIMAYMEDYDPLAKKIGYVDTVINEDSKLAGYNTNITGMIAALTEKTKISGKKILILGSENSARGIAYSLKEYGADIFIFDREIENSKNLAKEFDVNIIDYRMIPAEKFDIIINTTNIGEFPNINESLLNAKQMHKDLIIMDTIINPIETEFIKSGKEAGAITISGERSLLHQVAGQFEIWHGKKSPFDIIEKILYNEIVKNK